MLQPSKLSLPRAPQHKSVSRLHPDHVGALTHHLPLAEVGKLGLVVGHIYAERRIQLRVHDGGSDLSVYGGSHLVEVTFLAEVGRWRMEARKLLFACFRIGVSGRCRN